LEALVVSINTGITRPDGGSYHITLSLDPNKYSPKHSNDLIAKKGYNTVTPYLIKVEPKFFR
jgi:hypothetical protein